MLHHCSLRAVCTPHGTTGRMSGTSLKRSAREFLSALAKATKHRTVAGPAGGAASFGPAVIPVTQSSKSSLSTSTWATPVLRRHCRRKLGWKVLLLVRGVKPRHGQSLSLLGFPMASKPAFTQAQHWGTNFQSASRTHGVRPSPPKLPLPLSSQPTPLHGAFSGRSRTRAVSSMHTHVTS